MSERCDHARIGSVIHLSGERGWRGGESQLALQVHYVAGGWESTAYVRAGSELQRRLDASHVELLGGFGFFQPRGALHLVKALKARGGHKVLHAHSSKALETALLARIGIKVPLVVSRRTAFPVRSGWKYRVADAVIAVSDAARGELVRAGVPDERIVIIPDAVDADQYDKTAPERLGLSDEAVMVLCAAAFAEEKDHRTLLGAWKQVECRNTDAHLFLAGEGRLHEATARLSAEFGLRRVHFLGWRDDLPRLVAGCDIAALSSRMEGLSSFLCEAQWCGKAVAATDAGGIGEAVADGETGLLSAPGDADALARNLLHLVEDRDLRKGLGAAALSRARTLFDPLAVAAAHQQVYERLLDDVSV